jgi:hypothetical protein
MASYGRDHGGPRGWFDRWFGGGGGRGGYDRGFRSGGRGYDRPFGRGYDRSDYRSIPPWGKAGREGGYGGQGGQGGGYFNPGYMVDEAWGGAFARGDAQYQGRRMYGDDYRTGRPGYSGGYDRPYRGGGSGGGAGYGSPGGWRAFGRGYDRGYDRGR